MKHTMTKKIWTGVAAATLATLVGVATGPGFAAAAEDGSRPARERPDLAGLVCERLDELDARLADVLADIDTRQQHLAVRRAEAVGAGRDRLVERIDRVAARSADRAARVRDRIDRLDAWAAEHCPPA